MAPAAGFQGLSIVPAAGSQGVPAAAAGGWWRLVGHRPRGVPGGSIGHRESLAAAPATGGPWRQHWPPGVPSSSIGHRGSLAGVIARRPPAARPIAYAAIAYFLGSCCALGQLLPTFWATWGFWLPAARTGVGGRSEPRARWEGPYGTRGGRAAAAAAAAGARPNRRRRRKRRRSRGVRWAPWAAAGHPGPPLGTLGRRWAAAERRSRRGPPRSTLGRCGAP